MRFIYLNHSIQSSWYVLYLLDLRNVLFSMGVCMILFPPYLNFLTLISDSILQQTNILRCFWMLFLKGKWLTYSWPDGNSFGCSNTCPVVIIVLVELSINCIASKIFLYRSTMFTCLLPLVTVNSRVIESWFFCSWMWDPLRVQFSLTFDSRWTLLRCIRIKLWFHLFRR